MQDINTALVKLYAGMNAPQLEVLLRNGNLHAQDLENWLMEHKVPVNNNQKKERRRGREGKGNTRKLAWWGGEKRRYR